MLSLVRTPTIVSFKNLRMLSQIPALTDAVVVDNVVLVLVEVEVVEVVELVVVEVVVAVEDDIVTVVAFCDRSTLLVE